MKNLFITALLLTVLIIQMAAQNTGMRVERKHQFSPWFPYRGYEAKATYTYDKIPKTLKVWNGSGNITIVQSSENRVWAEVHVKLTSFSRKTAKKYLEKFAHIGFEEKGQKLVFKNYLEVMKEKRNSSQGKIRIIDISNNVDGTYKTVDFGGFFGTPFAHANVKLFVPKGVKLIINDRARDIKIANLENNIEINDHSGRIICQAIHGNVDIDDNSGRIMVKGIHGNLTIDDNSGRLVAKNIKKDCSVKDNAGRTLIKDIGGECRVDDLSGRLYLENIGKGLYVDDEAGMIKLSNIGFLNQSSTKVTIYDNSGKIRGESIAAQFITIDDHSGSIRLTNTSGHVKVDNNTGRLVITGDKSNLSKSGNK